MMRVMVVATIGASLLVLAAPAAAAPVTETEAAKAFAATIVGWTSMDAARIKALYAPGIVGFDYTVGPLSTDRATWDKAQDGYAAARIDSATVVAQKVQLLGPDAFVVSSQSDVRSSSLPAGNGTVRCTDVYQRGGNGQWLIVNEHCSAMPKA